MSLLDRIDNVIAGDVCPCGAEPRDDSAYCSEDCTPTHHGIHTVSHLDGTQMRWRPDLVTAIDDSDLALIAEVPRSSRLSAQFYARTGTLDVHLRLHDGYRFVGLDVPADQAGNSNITPAGRPELEPFWQRLERELVDSRRLDPDPWQASDDPWADVMQRQQQGVNAAVAAMPTVASAFRGMSEAMGSVVNRLRELQPLIAAERKPEPEHPLARMAARRRDVVHGPRTPRRPPRSLNVGRR